MPRWRLLLSPPVVSTSSSRLRLPRRPLSSSHHRAVPRRQVAVAPSTAVAPHRPSPSIHHHAVHRRPSPLFSRSIAAALALPLAVEEQSRRPLPSRSGRAVPCRRGAVAPSITVKDRCCVRRPLLLLLLLLRSHPDLLPVGGAPDDSRPLQPLPPPLLVLLAPAALLAPLRAFAPADHPHFSPPAPIEATAPPPFVVAARMLSHP